jgi:hypothetical protein
MMMHMSHSKMSWPVIRGSSSETVKRCNNNGLESRTGNTSSQAHTEPRMAIVGRHFMEEELEDARRATE